MSLPHMQYLRSFQHIFSLKNENKILKKYTMFLCFLKKKKKFSINMTQVNMTQYFHQVYSTGFINKFCFCKCASTDEQMDQLKAHFTILHSNCSLYIFKADLESVAGKMISYKNTNKYDRFSLVLTQNLSSWTFAVGVLHHALTHPIHTS